MAAYRQLLQDTTSSNQDTAPFFGFIGAAAALVFSCEELSTPRDLLFGFVMTAWCRWLPALLGNGDRVRSVQNACFL